MKRIKQGAGLMTALLIVGMVPTTALATNGMYLGGYGSEAAGRAGANIAVADRSLGLQANPAGMCQLMGNHYSVDMQVLMPTLDYSDPSGNAIGGDDRSFLMPAFSYVRGARDSDWTWGVGMVSQGGMGATFEGYNTPFGSQDQTYSQVRFATINPTVAYSVNDDLAFGVTANLGWSDVDFRYFPETSVYNDMGTPTDPTDDFGFFGVNLVDHPRAFGYSLRAGMMWTVNPQWQVGAIYQTETEGDYEDGKLSLDMSSLGLGSVVYNDAVVDGFTWPEQYGVGVQFRPADRWVLALDVKTFAWSNALDIITVSASDPGMGGVMPTVELPPFVFKWDDQTVVALGMEYRANDELTVRAGFNHGDSPVPDATLTPLFPATPEDHATVGVGWNLQSYTLNFAVEHAFEASQTNTAAPFTDPFAGSTVDHSQWTISFGFSKAFSRS